MIKDLILRKVCLAVLVLFSFSVLDYPVQILKAQDTVENLAKNKMHTTDFQQKSVGTDRAMIESRDHKYPESGLIESPGVKKEKKKFPVMLTVVGVAFVSVMILLLTKKKQSESDRSKQLAREVYDSINWVTIPAAEFKMGTDLGFEPFLNEGPVHTVYLDSYSIGKYEVTFDQYDKFCQATKRKKPFDEGWGRGDLPVTNISWYDAKAFCDWISEQTGKNVHLPTEAQWEKAARGTDQRTYPWGNQSPISSLCNFGYQNAQTTKVGSYPQGVSPYGIHDMAGNVSEWCADVYDADYYKNSPKTNPQGPLSGQLVCIRGGSWMQNTHGLRSGYRGMEDPNNSRYRDYSGPSIGIFGIRLARD